MGTVQKLNCTDYIIVGKEKNSSENFEVEKSMNKITKLMVMGIMLTTSAAACAKIPAFTAATETSMPTVTPLPSPTPVPTETENPFEGLSVCKTWQEAENCSITVADFERLPDYVKANFTFPSDAFDVDTLVFMPNSERTSYIAIYAISAEEKKARKEEIDTFLKSEGKNSILESSLSPIGKPYFFMLKENPPTNNYDCWVAVFPVNNADGSVGTYTIIVPSYTFAGDYESAEEWTKANLKRKFEKLPYLPPVYNMGWIPESNYMPDKQGSSIKEIFEDTNDPNGKRMELFIEWEKTGIIPEELEKLPLFGSDMNADGGVKFSD